MIVCIATLLSDCMPDRPHDDLVIIPGSPHHMYKLFEQRVNYDAAEQDCASQGMRLATIKTSEAFAYFSEHVGN